MRIRDWTSDVCASDLIRRNVVFKILKLGSLTIERRMLLRLAAVVFFQLLVGGVGLWGLAQASNALRSFFDVELLETSALARVGADMNMVGIDLRRAALSESASVVAETLPRVKPVMADVGDRIADLDTAATDPRDRAQPARSHPPERKSRVE